MKSCRARIVATCSLLSLATTLTVLLYSRNDVTYQGKSVRTWALLLKSQSQQSRIDATNAFLLMGTNAAPGLVALLSKQDSHLQVILWQLSAKLPGSVQAFVRKKAGTPDGEQTRNLAAQALGLLGASGQIAIPALRKVILEDPPNRWAAADALSRTGAVAVPELALLAFNTNYMVRTAAVKSLGNCGEDALPALHVLIWALDDPNEPTRFSAAQSLPALGQKAFEILSNNLTNPSPAMRCKAMRAIQCFPQARVQTLSRLLEGVNDHEVACRMQALRTLSRVGAPNFQMIDAFLKALDDPSVEVRLLALQALKPARLKRTIVVEKLSLCLNDENAQIRESAAALLGGLRNSAEPARNQLIQLLSDPNERVRSAADQALKRIAPVTE
jgi:HEAT repeat protein